MPLTLVMINRTSGCPLSTLARRVLDDLGVDYVEQHYDLDPAVRERLLRWTGYLSIPTLYVADGDPAQPIAPPEPIAPGMSPRGIDRGSMLTEPNTDQLMAWLRKHGLTHANEWLTG
ncbi:MAG: glutaredoxin family protein [Chloroflexi bacterium]|nr:glutaredoxin family protein [Chloroflexota bacterium]